MQSITSIQTLAKKVWRARELHGRRSVTTDDAVLSLLSSIATAGKPDQQAIVVDPGTLVIFNEVGIHLSAGYNTPEFGRQPWVTINTDELHSHHHYSTIGQVGESPAIAVHLNDADLFDDQGAGNIAPAVDGTKVFVVVAHSSDDEPAVFVNRDDAGDYAETFTDAEVIELPVAGKDTAAKMVKQRNPVIESPSGWSYRESQENGDEVDCQSCGNSLDDDLPISNDESGYAHHVACRLEYLRAELRAERISYGELAELQGLAEHIAPDDVELREAAGLPEHVNADTEDQA